MEDEEEIRWGLERPDPTTVSGVPDDRPVVDVDRVRSRERAVGRVFKGLVTAGVGWLGMMAVSVADAVAEQFETWFLDSSLLRGLDTWAVGGVILFVVVGAFLLRDDAGGGDAGEEE